MSSFAGPGGHSLLRQIVEAEGLLLLGVVPVDVEQAYARFAAWVDEGKHAGLEFLEGNRDLRRQPERLLPGVRRAVVLALPYDQGDDAESFEAPRVAQYARFLDYHRVLWDRGERIAARIETDLAPGCRTRVLSDSAPVLERALAALGPRGFVGKNTCFIHPEAGSFLLIGEILTTAPLTLDEPSLVDSRERTADGGCGTCTLCQVECPTGALHADYTLDTEKCLAYWTIEHRGEVPEEFWPHFAKYWYGCDLCQLACPYNRKARGYRLPGELKPRSLPPLEYVALMSDVDYQIWFGGTSMTRGRREGLRRNALIALAAIESPALPDVLGALADETDPVLLGTMETIRKRGRWEARRSGEPG